MKTCGEARFASIALACVIGLTSSALSQQVVDMIPANDGFESHQDSEPNVAVNPSNPNQIAASAFIPPQPKSPDMSPILISSDGGSTWNLAPIVPGSNHDITLRFADTSGLL